MGRLPFLAAAAAILCAATACSSSFGSGGGSSPSRTYVVLPNGEAVPAQTTSRPPSGNDAR
ncbi:MAG: hypothetical protein INR65_12000 [Gluconacetobacter diazotrophicus]|nr:hypothetical protein [Gluconacetobacter diazotrophicus]